MSRPFFPRSIAIVLTAGALLLGSLALAGGATAATKIATTTTCSNDYLTKVAGLGIICEVTVVNRITTIGGSATVTVHECHGPAGPAPVQTDCSTKTTTLGQRVTNVTQCNGSINGGGETLRCSVNVTNDFVGLSPGATAATVNQCVGSGSITTGCDPFPATTSGATITQCNGSAGGGTLVQLTCHATGTKSSAAGVTINQCNGSANGGGALVICSANVTNRGISSFSPSEGSPGTVVTINGSGFTGATAVKFHGTNARSFTVVSNTKIIAIVASGTTSGTISVTGPGGTGSSSHSLAIRASGSGSGSSPTGPPTDQVAQAALVPSNTIDLLALSGVAGLVLLSLIAATRRFAARPVIR
jgi:hypothetical protein